MKKGLVFLVIGILALSYVMAACIDTDGDDIYSPGVVSDPNNPTIDAHVDACVDSKTVWEYVCIDDVATGYAVQCENICENGHCMLGSTPLLYAECVDTDGDNTYIRGYLVAKENGEKVLKHDSCIDRFTLFEQTCEGGRYVDCPKGCLVGQGVCSREGAAAVPTVGCYDSDDFNPFAKGSVTLTDQVTDAMIDYCYDYETVYEQGCTAQTSGLYKCPHSCYSGKCELWVGETPSNYLSGQAVKTNASNPLARFFMWLASIFSF